MNHEKRELPDHERHTGQDSPRYQSLDQLREGHTALHRSTMQSGDNAQEIRDFLSNAREAGAYIGDTTNRKAAQAILDYWGAELATLQGATPDDFTPVVLDAFALGKARTAVAGHADKAEQHALIRFSAFAREWVASGKDPGFLLSGDAIRQAARYREHDADLDAFVTASETAEDARLNRKKIMMIAGASVLTLTLCLSGLILWQFIYLRAEKDSHIAGLKSKSLDAVTTLKWLQIYQFWLPPYDFSGGVDLENVSLPRLTLAVPNFADASFNQVRLPGAELAGASFEQSKFSFDGRNRPIDLSRANLRQAQFKNARIAFTSFNGADLYRATFDRAVLCDVDFSGANLRSASFWAVTMNEKTKRSLQNTAWWQAVGWPWSQIIAMANSQENDDERATRLRASNGFKEDLLRGMVSLRNSKEGTLSRALALNDIAWTRAVWGVDVDSAAMSQAAAADESETCGAQDPPADAPSAAKRAVCILETLDRGGDTVPKHRELLATAKDTLAYISMQSKRMKEALNIYEEIRTDYPNALETSDTLFRYAIAEYFAGDDKAKAIRDFGLAVLQKRYQPTHELQTLRQYIFAVPEFVENLQTLTNQRWPFMSGQTSCPM